MRRIEGIGCWAPNIFTVSASTQSLFLSSALQIITDYANTIQITTQGKFCTKHLLLNTRTQVLIFIPDVQWGQEVVKGSKGADT